MANANSKRHTAFPIAQVPHGHKKPGEISRGDNYSWSQDNESVMVDVVLAAPVHKSEIVVETLRTRGTRTHALSESPSNASFALEM